MADKTYNTGRVVGWSTYEEFLKETQLDPNSITNYVYSTLVTYGVTRRVALNPGEGSDAWKASGGGLFYIQTVRVPGASWGAVPIVGMDYEAYLNVFSDPAHTSSTVEEADVTKKEIIEKALANIFSVYVSDADGNKARSSASDHGYLTFVAYPDILDFNESVPELSGGSLKLIVRGLSLEDLDVGTLYFGPQGLLTTGSGGPAPEKVHLSTIDISALCLNASNYIWMSTGGNGSTLYRLANQPAGEVMTSTFGYLNPDLVNGEHDFSSMGRYGLTYAEYQDATQDVPCIRDQEAAIPNDSKDDYVYLLSGQPSYPGLPDSAHPLFVIPVRKGDYYVNIGDDSGFNAENRGVSKMKKYMDFAYHYSSSGDVDHTSVLYIPSKVLPDYLGSYWGSSNPSRSSLDYFGGSLGAGRWLDDISALGGVTYGIYGRVTSLTFELLYPIKGEYLVVTDQTTSPKELAGLYQCVADIRHGYTANEFIRRGAYLNYTLPSWTKDGDYNWKVDLSGKTVSVSGSVLTVDGAKIYPGELIVIGTEGKDSQDKPNYRVYYVLDTVSGSNPALIVSTDLYLNVSVDAQATIATDNTIPYAYAITVDRTSWNNSLARTITVHTDETHTESMTISANEISQGLLVEFSHKDATKYGYDTWYVYTVIEQTATVVRLASAMIWTDNPNIAAISGHPARYNSAFPRYKQNIPDASGSYKYNVSTALNSISARQMFTDFGWNIADYVDADYQSLNLLQFLQECVIRSDMTVPMSDATKKTTGVVSVFNLYSIRDLHYTSGQIPATGMAASIALRAATDTKSFFGTAYYSATKVDGTPVPVNNPNYPIWVTLGEMDDGTQTMSVSVIDDAGSQLDFSGNAGSIESDHVRWIDLLVGLSSGKSIDVLKGSRFGRGSDDCTWIESPNGTRIYIATSEPTGDIPEGSIGIGW